MLLGLRHKFNVWFGPVIDALFAPSLSFDLRWRLLALQPISILTNLIAKGPWLFSKPWTEEYLRLPQGNIVRLLVFKSKGKKDTEGSLRPLHLNMHGGAFLGG